MTDTTNTPVHPRPGGSASLGSHTVARIGYGAMQLGRLQDRPAEARAVLRHALDLGVDHVDTAYFYDDGFVNDVIRDTLHGGDDVVVVSKIGATPNPGGAFPIRAAQRPEELRASVEDNLRSLGVEQIAIVNLRRMDAGAKIPGSPAEQDVDLDDQLEVMIAMREAGLIGGVGLSSVSLDVLRRGLPAGIVCVQNAYSLVDRSDEALLQLCVEQGVAWVPYFPLGSAFPGMPKVTDQPAVRDIAAELDASPAQVGLAWLLQHAPDLLLIPGTTSADHLDANLAAGDVHLDPDAVAALDAVTA